MSTPIMRRAEALSAAEPVWYLRQPIIHRGLHNIFDGVLEQTRTSVARAIAAGLPIEVDIENSIDDRSFVIHDPILDKLTNGTGRLRNLTAERIRAAHLHYTDSEPIMFLEELLELVDGQVPIVIEFKNRELVIPRAIAKAADVLSRYKGEFAITAFSPILLEWFAERYPEMTRGLITTDTDTLEGRDQFMVCLLRGRVQPHFAIHQWCQLNCWTFQWVLEQDIPVLAWTVRDEDDWAIARSYADNMFFEFVAPCKDDWRRPADVNWRAEVGERVDRRFSRNQPVNLKHDGFKGTTPWWMRNRSWAPSCAPKPAPAGAETAASYDAALLALSVFENKRDAYKIDPQFRAAWLDWKAAFGDYAIVQATRTALLLAPAGPDLERLMRSAEQVGLRPLVVWELSLARSTCHVLMRHLWATAAAERVSIDVQLLMLQPLSVVLLRDAAPEPRVPGTLRLFNLLAAEPEAPAPGPDLMATCVEPADLIRLLDVLFTRPERAALLGALARLPANVGVGVGVDESAQVPTREQLLVARASSQARFPDKAGPFADLVPATAITLWRSRAS